MESAVKKEGVTFETQTGNERSQHVVVRRFTESRNPEQLIRALIEAHMC